MTSPSGSVPLIAPVTFDATGNLKATQKLLGHASISTTGDIYADWDIDQLAETMRLVLEGD